MYGYFWMKNKSLYYYYFSFFTQANKRRDEEQLDKQVQQLVKESKSCQKDPKTFTATEKATCVSKKAKSHPPSTYLDTFFSCT